MDEADQLHFVVEQQTEEFLCKIDDNSEWLLYNYDKDGTRSIVTYEVTDVTPPDRSIILRNWDTQEEFVITWSVFVAKR